MDRKSDGKNLINRILIFLYLSAFFYFILDLFHSSFIHNPICFLSFIVALYSSNDRELLGIFLFGINIAFPISLFSILVVIIFVDISFYKLWFPFLISSLVLLIVFLMGYVWCILKFVFKVIILNILHSRSLFSNHRY